MIDVIRAVDVLLMDFTYLTLKQSVTSSFFNYVLSFDETVAHTLHVPICLFYTFLTLLFLSLYIFLTVILHFGPVMLNFTEKQRSKEKAVMCSKTDYN